MNTGADMSQASGHGSCVEVAGSPPRGTEPLSARAPQCSCVGVSRRFIWNGVCGLKCLSAARAGVPCAGGPVAWRAHSLVTVLALDLPFPGASHAVIPTGECL